jgi:hypothetical protein
MIIEITEDQALGYDVSLTSLIEEKEKQGFLEFTAWEPLQSPKSRLKSGNAR